MIRDILAYDSESRGIDRDRLDKSGFRAIPGGAEILRRAIELLSISSSATERTIARELGEIFSNRIFFLLLPEECLFGDPDRDKPVIRNHLRALGLQADEDLVTGIKFFVDNFRSKTRSEQPKSGITDVFVKFPRIYDQILRQQNGRCAVCGTDLIYGHNMQLDHVLPWHLGDDPNDGSNWQFLCERCNRGKGIWPHYVLSSVYSNWLKPAISHGLSDEVRYAVLKRDGVCGVSGRGPNEVELRVHKKIESGCWLLDNAVVRAIDVSP